MPQLEHSYGSSATTSQPRFFWGSSCRASEPPRTPLPKTWAAEGHGGTGVWPLAGPAPGSRAGSAHRRTRPTSAPFSTCSSSASLNELPRTNAATPAPSDGWKPSYQLPRAPGNPFICRVFRKTSATLRKHRAPGESARHEAPSARGKAKTGLSNAPPDPPLPPFAKLWHRFPTNGVISRR